MNIYQRLKEDHGKQRGLAGGLAETSGNSDERKRLFAELKHEVEAHAAAEEQTFYAELISQADGQDQARHSVSEHKEAADLFGELEKIDMSSGAWLQKFKQLKHELDHHVDEEEAEVFPLAQRLISEKRARDLAGEFETRKTQALKG